VQATFARAAKQLLAGVALGAAVAVGMDQLAGEKMLRGHAAELVPAVAVLMLLIGLLAALGPARRAVRINPIETLRAE
jgi:ABC-type antimicrobial peptide transport system permease subunit